MSLAKRTTTSNGKNLLFSFDELFSETCQGILLYAIQMQRAVLVKPFAYQWATTMHYSPSRKHGTSNVKNVKHAILFHKTSHTDHQARIEEPLTSLLSTHQMKKREANGSSVSLKCSHGEYRLFIATLTIYSKEYFSI